MTLGAFILAFALFELDRVVPGQYWQGHWFVLQGDKNQARTLIITVATTALGIISIVFSVTLVPLSIASSQFGSSILRAFMRDVPTQVVLGTYSATIAYCMVIVLRLSTGRPDDNIPQLSATFAFYLLFLCLILLLYFFHHIATSFRSTRVVALISKELGQVIGDDFPSSKPVEQALQRAANEEMRLKILQEGETVPAHSTGYISAWDINWLTGYAGKLDLVLLLSKITGDFVAAGDPLLLAWTTGKPDMKAAVVELNNACMISEARTMVQDVRLGINQLVIIASRALSPAVNDPETPILCIDRLAAALGLIAERETPYKYFYGKDSTLRVIMEPPGFALLVEASFSHIRQYGRNTTEVLLRMLGALQTISYRVKRDTDRAVLLKHAALIEQDSRTGLPAEYDRNRVQMAYEETVRAINKIHS
jgi:uncharacterized membrane protein